MLTCLIDTFAPQISSECKVQFLVIKNDEILNSQLWNARKPAAGQSAALRDRDIRDIPSAATEARRSQPQPHCRGAVRSIGGTQFTYNRWRKYGGLKTDQMKRLKELEKENERLRKAVSHLALEKLILRGAASGNF